MQPKTLEILQALEACGTKRKAKLQILRDNLENEELQRCFSAAYDWRISYGLRVRFFESATASAAKRSALFGSRSEFSFWALLDKLQKRELTGNAAKAAWDEMFAVASDLEKIWFTRILNKDLRIGLDVKSVAAVWPDLLSPWAVQLAEKFDFDKKNPLLNADAVRKFPWQTFPVVVEPKLDGMRVVFEYFPDTKSVSAYSREGHDLPNISKLCEKLAHQLAASNAPRLRLDSEAFADEWGDTISFVKGKDVDDEKRNSLKFWIFDVVREIPGDSRPHTERMDFLKTLFPESVPLKNFKVIPSKYLYTMEEVLDEYNQLLDLGNEGAMLKFGGAPYKATRNVAWLKLKPEHTIDAVILDVEPGEVGKKNAKWLGAFKIQRKDNGVVCKCGGGFSDAQRQEFWDRREELVGMTVEVREQSQREGIAISFPKFIRLREDL